MNVDMVWMQIKDEQFFLKMKLLGEASACDDMHGKVGRSKGWMKYDVRKQ